MATDVADRHETAGESATAGRDQSRSLTDFEMVCLFSAIGLLVTAISLNAIEFNEMVLALWITGH